MATVKSEETVIKKPWYKTGWGIILIILFFPYIGIWWVWAKSNWNVWLKVGATIGILGFIAWSLTLSGRSTTTSTTNSNQNQTNEQQQAQYVFDVPPLVGKNIDEIRTILGKPVDKNIEPPEAQRDLFKNDWDNTFQKNGNDKVELLVNFDPESRKVKEFFIDTDDSSGQTNDKKHLLELGNLKENDPHYRVVFTQAIGNDAKQGYYTGVHIIPK